MKKLMFLITTLALATVSSAGPVSLLPDPGFEKANKGLIPDGWDAEGWRCWNFNAEVIDTFYRSGLKSGKMGLNTTANSNFRAAYYQADAPESFANQNFIVGFWVYYDSTEGTNNPSVNGFNVDLVGTCHWNIPYGVMSFQVRPPMLIDRGWTYIERTLTTTNDSVNTGDTNYVEKEFRYIKVIFVQDAKVSGMSGVFYIDDVVIKRANYWFSPSPAVGQADLLPGTVPLVWDNPDPNVPGDNISVSVSISTNSDMSSAMPLLTGSLNAETVDATGLLPLTTYYWQITAVDAGVTHTSRIYHFTTSTANQTPVVDAGPDLLTYLTEGTVDVVMQGSVTDEGSTVNSWTATAKNPAGIADPTIDPVDALNATVTLTEVGTYTLTLSADDGEKIGTDQMVITVAADACAAAKLEPGYVYMPGDINVDCKVNFDDFVSIALGWLENNALTGPVILP